MTKEQIKQAAIKHADEIVCENCRESRVYAYIAGAESRQAEIDELIGAIEEIRMFVMFYSNFVAHNVYLKTVEILKKYKQ